MKRRYHTEEQIVKSIDRAKEKIEQHRKELSKIRLRIRALRLGEEKADMITRADMIDLLNDHDREITQASARVSQRLQRLKNKLAEFRTPVMPLFGADQSIPV